MNFFCIAIIPWTIFHPFWRVDTTERAAKWKPGTVLLTLWRARGRNFCRKWKIKKRICRSGHALQVLFRTFFDIFHQKKVNSEIKKFLPKFLIFLIDISKTTIDTWKMYGTLIVDREKSNKKVFYKNFCISTGNRVMMKKLNLRVFSRWRKLHKVILVDNLNLSFSSHPPRNIQNLAFSVHFHF